MRRGCPSSKPHASKRCGFPSARHCLFRHASYTVTRRSRLGIGIPFPNVSGLGNAAPAPAAPVPVAWGCSFDCPFLLPPCGGGIDRQ